VPEPASNQTADSLILLGKTTNFPLAQFSSYFSNSDDHPMPMDSSHDLHFNNLGLSGVSHWPTSDSKANSQHLLLASHEALFSLGIMHICNPINVL